MKMNYPLKSNRHDRKKALKLFIIPLLFLVVIVGLNFIKPNLFAPASHVVATPFLKLKDILTKRFSGTLGYFSFKNNLLEENRILKEKLEEFEGVVLRTNLLVKENEELKLEFGRETPSKRILAYVLSSPGSFPYDTLLLDVGTSDGIKDGDKIIVFPGIPFGYIKETYSHTSLARLYSSPGEETTVLIPPDGFMGKAYGRGGGSFVINLPNEMKIKKGDILSFPGITDGIAGIVESVEADDTQALKDVFFRSPFNIYQVNKVYIESQ